MVETMSYAEIMDAAYSLEIRKEEYRAAKESGKKQKMKGTFLVDLVPKEPKVIRANARHQWVGPLLLGLFQ